MLRLLSRTDGLLTLASLLALAAIGGAWFSELGLGFVPCKLCLWQRWPYYIAAPLVVTAFLRLRQPEMRSRGIVLIALLGLIFVVSTGLGVYHAGVEWKLWAGPSDCGGRLATLAPSLDDFRKSLNTARVVLCDEAPMRILGLSFAGWNAVISAGISALYFAAAKRAARA